MILYIKCKLLKMSGFGDKIHKYFMDILKFSNNLKYSKFEHCNDWIKGEIILKSSIYAWERIKGRALAQVKSERYNTFLSVFSLSTFVTRTYNIREIVNYDAQNVSSSTKTQSVNVCM